jgi:hypothetical protein
MIDAFPNRAHPRGFAGDGGISYRVVELRFRASGSCGKVDFVSPTVSRDLDGLGLATQSIDGKTVLISVLWMCDDSQPHGLATEINVCECSFRKAMLTSHPEIEGFLNQPKEARIITQTLHRSTLELAEFGECPHLLESHCYLPGLE